MICMHIIAGKTAAPAAHSSHDQVRSCPVHVPCLMAGLPASQDAKVERFVVVHGQIILNQFRHYPSKAVQASAFATALKAAMESRRHSKLYMGSAKSKRPVAGNRNPMKACPCHVPHWP